MNTAMEQARRLRALFGGYFWIPCPLCGEYFGGSEWLTESEFDVVEMEGGRGTGICPNCTMALERVARWDPSWKLEEKTSAIVKARDSLVRAIREPVRTAMAASANEGQL